MVVKNDIMKIVGPSGAPDQRHFLLPDCALAVLLTGAVFASYCKYLSDTCPDATIYTPSGFPCCATVHQQAIWLLRRPSLVFRLSDNPLHRCWGLVTAVVVSLSWLLYLLLRGRTTYHYGAWHKTAFLSAMRLLPKAAVLAQPVLSGRPSSTLAWFFATPHGMVDWRRGGIALLFALNTSEDCLAAYLATSLLNALSVAAIPVSWCLAAHGHATWIPLYMASVAFVYMGIPLLASACMALRKVRRRRTGSHALGGGDGAAGAAEKCAVMLQPGNGTEASVADLDGVTCCSSCHNRLSSAAEQYSCVGGQLSDPAEQSQHAILLAEHSPTPTALLSGGTRSALSGGSVCADDVPEAAAKRCSHQLAPPLRHGEGGGVGEGTAGAADRFDAAQSSSHRLAPPLRRSTKPMYTSTIRHVRVVVKVGGSNPSV